jgi:hypothetical protein
MDMTNEATKAAQRKETNNKGMLLLRPKLDDLQWMEAKKEEGSLSKTAEAERQASKTRENRQSHGHTVTWTEGSRKRLSVLTARQLLASLK